MTSSEAHVAGKCAHFEAHVGGRRAAFYLTTGDAPRYMFCGTIAFFIGLISYYLRDCVLG
jgi:hypothetical protein